MTPRVLSVPDTDRLDIGRLVLYRQPEHPAFKAAMEREYCFDFTTWQERKSSNALRVVCSSDKTLHGQLLHVSISHQGHLPSWREIREARALFFPDDIDVMMVLPKAADYVNLHQFTFHLWQTPFKWGIR